MAEKILPPGYTVRLALLVLPLFYTLAPLYNLRTMNKLLARMVLSVIDLCLSPTMKLPESSILKFHSADAKEIWAKLARDDIRRSLPNTETVSVKITFPRAPRQDLFRISQSLRWAEGQFVLEALQSFCELAGAEGMVQRMPDALDLYRGRLVNAGALAYQPMEVLLSDLNRELGYIKRPSLEQLESAELSMTQSVFSDASGYVPNVPEINTPKN